MPSWVGQRFAGVGPGSATIEAWLSITGGDKEWCRRAIGDGWGRAQVVAVVWISRCCCRLLSSHTAAATPMVAAVQAVSLGGRPGGWEAPGGKPPGRGAVPLVKAPWGVRMARVGSVAV